MSHPQSFHQRPASLPTYTEIVIAFEDWIVTTVALQDVIDQHLQGEFEMSESELAFLSGAVAVLSAATNASTAGLQKVFD